jgi:1-acyl-sn-glycerol-3-phosphate acyltransferase
MSVSEHVLQRRLLTIPALLIAAPLLTVTMPVWLPLVVVVDALRLRKRLPIARLLMFGVCWTWLETIAMLLAFGTWALGQSRNQRLHYALQRWWARQLLGALRVTCGLRVDVANTEALTPGPVLLFVRHASLADSLVSAYVLTSLAGLHPRYVLKKELLIDPCLDVVGNRIPNYFLDRGTNDAAPEIAAVQRLVSDMSQDDAAVIFPEGTRANPHKLATVLAKLADRDPRRAEKLSVLRHLLPPRPSGALAMVRGAPDVDVVLAWHIGFEGLDTFAGILKALNRPFAPIRFVARRVASGDVPRDDDFTGWLDDQWIRMDSEVGAALHARDEGNH